MTVYIAEDINLKYTNVTKDDYPEYNATTIYKKADRFSVVEEGMNYYTSSDTTESGLIPSENSKIFSKSPMNFKKMFSYDIDTVTEFPELIEVKFDAINIDSITLAQLDAKEVEIVCKDNDTNTVIFEKIYDLLEDELNDFSDYCFAEQIRKSKLSTMLDAQALNNVINSMNNDQFISRFTVNPPIYFDIEVTIKIKNEGAIAKCGAVCIGREMDLGATLVDGAAMGIEDYEAIEEKEEWDETSITSGYTYDYMELQVNIPAKKFNSTFNRLKRLRGKLLVFRGIEHENFYATTIIGKYKELKMPIHPQSITYKLVILSYIKDYN